MKDPIFLNQLLQTIMFENKFENLIYDLCFLRMDKVTFEFKITLSVKKRNQTFKGLYYIKTNTIVYHNGDELIGRYNRIKYSKYLEKIFKSNKPQLSEFSQYYEELILSQK